MKRAVFLSILAAITLNAVSQVNNIQVHLSGYNVNDTIRLDDLLKISKMFLNSRNYPVISFVMVYNYGNYDYMMISNSNSLTEDMKNRLTKFRTMNVRILKISFKAITVVTPQNEQIKLGPLKYILKIT
jgi:hypothetical protein